MFGRIQVQFLLYTCFFALRSFGRFLLRHFGHWNIWVISILDITAFTSLYFPTLWLNWLKFFRPSKTISLWLKKLVCTRHIQTRVILTILTSKSARVSDFSPHVIFAVIWQKIYDFTEAMIDKTLIAFNQGWGVGGKISDSVSLLRLSKISDSDSLT